MRAWEPYSAALVPALSCGRSWSQVTRVTVADPLLWHARGTTHRARVRRATVQTVTLCEQGSVRCRVSEILTVVAGKCRESLCGRHAQDHSCG